MFYRPRPACLARLTSVKELAVLVGLAVASGCASAGGPTSDPSDRAELSSPDLSEAGLIVVADNACRRFQNGAALAIVRVELRSGLDEHDWRAEATIHLETSQLDGMAHQLHRCFRPEHRSA